MGKFRSAVVVGILLYLAADLPHCQHAICFLATKMTSATQHCWQVLRHLMLYLAGNQELCLSLNFKGDRSGEFHDYTTGEHAVIAVFTDAAWASCKDDRRSISSCAIFYGGCLLHASSRTQKIVSLSSAESEMYAAASGAYDSVLIVGILKWMFDAFFQICLYLDSAAARGIINRRGVGKVHHLSCRCLWLQERMADGSMIVSPISGLKNPADVGTKRLNVHHMRALMFLLGMFGSVNNCQVVETEAHTIVHQQEVKRAMQSVRRLVKSDDNTLKVLVLMNALGLARGQRGALQSTGLMAVSWWMAVICTAMAIVIGGWYVFRMRRSAYEPNVEDEPRESEEDRRQRYLHSTLSESSDVEFWMSIHHHSDNSSSEESEQIETNEVSRRVLSALDYGAETLRNTAIAAWLLARVNRSVNYSGLFRSKYESGCSSQGYDT